MRNLFVVVIVMALASVACLGGGSTADNEMREQTDALMAEANRQIGMPSIVNFQERKLAKMIFELRDQEDLVCYAYIVNLYGELIFIGECVGYGLPYSVQFTNPERVVHANSQGRLTLPQPDPNGLFMPEGLSATWLMLLDKETGQARPVYIEPQIIVSPFPLH